MEPLKSLRILTLWSRTRKESEMGTKTMLALKDIYDISISCSLYPMRFESKARLVQLKGLNQPYIAQKATERSAILLGIPLSI